MTIKIDKLIEAGNAYRTCLKMQTMMQDNEMLTIQMDGDNDVAILNLYDIQQSHAENELCATISKALTEYEHALNRRIKASIEGR